MDVSDTAQLAGLVRGVDAEFSVTEEILDIQPMKDTYWRVYLSRNRGFTISKYHISFDKLHGVSTEGAPAMVGSKIGLVTKRKA
jgi:hypothetical protein